MTQHRTAGSLILPRPVRSSAELDWVPSDWVRQIVPNEWVQENVQKGGSDALGLSRRESSNVQPWPRGRFCNKPLALTQGRQGESLGENMSSFAGRGKYATTPTPYVVGRFPRPVSDTSGGRPQSEWLLAPAAGKEDDVVMTASGSQHNIKMQPCCTKGEGDKPLQTAIGSGQAT